MNCQQFEARLNDLLDERAPLELDDALHGHLRGCAPCRELWSGYADLVQVMRFRSPPAPASDLAERIVAAAVASHVDESLRDSYSRLGETRPRESSRHAPRAVNVHGTRSVPTTKSRRVWWRAAGIAAAAAVLIAVCWRFEPPSDRTTSPTGGLAQGETPAVESRALSKLRQDAANCYAGLARETRSDLSDVLALVPRVESTPAAVLWNSGEPVPTPEVASHVREGLRPLAQSTMAALTSLFGGTTPENGEL